MADVSWTLGTSSDGDVTADALVSDWPTIRPGATEQLRFRWDPGTRTSYETIRKYVRVASPDAVATNRGLDTTPFYRELQDDTEDLLMSFDPTGSGLPSTVTGFWAVLVGGRDESNNVLTQHVLELELFVLAELSTYSTRSGAEAVHEV